MSGSIDLELSPFVGVVRSPCPYQRRECFCIASTGVG